MLTRAIWAALRAGWGFALGWGWKPVCQYYQNQIRVGSAQLTEKDCNGYSHSQAGRAAGAWPWVGEVEWSGFHLYFLIQQVVEPYPVRLAVAGQLCSYMCPYVLWVEQGMD